MATGVSRRTRYDMVLCDLRMPGLNGFELYERLKAQRPEVLPRLVFTTGEVAGSEAAELMRGVGCPVIHKPFDLSLVQEIAEQLTRS
ncbi:MAG: response regulator [Gemmatimonadaceae bacterium]